MRRSRWGGIVRFASMAALALAVLYPLVILVFTAFKTQGDLITNPTGPPTEWTFANFVKTWTEAGMATLMVNSLIVSAGVVIGTVVLSSLGGFALGRLRLRGTRILPFLLTVGLVLPFEVLMIPLFYSFRAVGMLDSYLSMILPQVALGLPFGILLVRTFIAELPQDFFDAAEIDGAGLWDQYLRVAMPLTRPALVALAVLELIWSWNQYLVALVMVQDPHLRTIPLGLSIYVGRHETNYNALAAAAVIALIPSLVLYIVFHREALRANLAGALK